MPTLTPTRRPIVASLKITSKGQVTLRKDLLEFLGVGPGDTVRVSATPEGNALIHPTRKKGSWDDIVGCLNAFYDGPPVTIEEMNEAIAAGWAGEVE